MAATTKPLARALDETAPQHYNPSTDAYEHLYGRNGASRVELYGPDGNPIRTTDNKLDFRAAELETLLGSLAAAAVTDPAAAASVIGLLKGQLCHQPTVRTVTTTPLAAETNFTDTVVDLTAAPGIGLVGFSIESDTVVRVMVDFSDGSTPAFAASPIDLTFAPWYAAGIQHFIPYFRPIGAKMRLLVRNPTGTAQTFLTVKEYRLNAPLYSPQNLRGTFAYNLEIRDTSTHNYTSDPRFVFLMTRLLFGGGKLPILVNNLHNQAVTAAIWMRTIGGVYGTFGSIQVPAGSTKLITNADFPGLDVPSETLYLVFSCATAPTSGAVSAYYDVLVGGSA